MADKPKELPDAFAAAEREHGRKRTAEELRQIDLTAAFAHGARDPDSWVAACEFTRAAIAADMQRGATGFADAARKAAQARELREVLQAPGLAYVGSLLTRVVKRVTAGAYYDPPETSEAN